MSANLFFCVIASEVNYFTNGGSLRVFPPPPVFLNLTFNLESMLTSFIKKTCLFTEVVTLRPVLSFVTRGAAVFCRHRTRCPDACGRSAWPPASASDRRHTAVERRLCVCVCVCARARMHMSVHAAKQPVAIVFSRGPRGAPPHVAPLRLRHNDAIIEQLAEDRTSCNRAF